MVGLNFTQSTAYGLLKKFKIPIIKYFGDQWHTVPLQLFGM